MNESDEMFTEIQDEGMADIGAFVDLDMDGKKYRGTLSAPDAATVMMTGNFQGRSVIVVRATKDQFASPPPQRGIVLITDQNGDESEWQRKEVSVDEINHYVLTLLRQLPA